MLIGVPRESAAGETRVAATPETVKKLIAQGHVLRIESGAGLAASVTDAAYAAAGAEIAERAGGLSSGSAAQASAARMPRNWAWSRPGANLVGMLNPFDREGLQALASAGLTSFALRSRTPHDPRAEHGRAVLAGQYRRLQGGHDRRRPLPALLPMLMTAAGTVKAARVVILGVGVAGLQAIATAKRLGAVIEASDVRPSVKEQVESLGAKFIDVPYETAEEKEAAEGRRRLCPPDAAELAGAAEGRSGQARGPGRHRHHDRADPRPRRAGCWSPRRWSRR